MKRVLAVLGAMALVGVVSATPANGLERIVADGQDDPAPVDITSVVYDNAERFAESTVHVRDLRRTGRLIMRFGVPDSDTMYDALVRSKADGTLATKLTYVNDIGSKTVDCAFAATWSADDDLVAVKVPQRCLDFNQFMEREWFQATMYRGPESDAAKGVDVGRGDTPGCVTKAEMGKVRHGDLKFRVHQRLDTAGKYGDSGAGSYARTYTACDGGARWFIQYSIEHDTVVNKGRLS